MTAADGAIALTKFHKETNTPTLPKSSQTSTALQTACSSASSDIAKELKTMTTGCLRRGTSMPSYIPFHLLQSAKLISVELFSHFWIGVSMIPEVQAREEELSARIAASEKSRSARFRGPVLGMLVIVEISK